MTAAALAERPRELTLTPFQQRVMLTPEDADLFLGGGRGGGKSFGVALLFLRHAEQYGGRARMLYLRRTFPGVVDFEQITREVFGMAYGPSASYNAGAHLWRFPTGATLQLDQLETVNDFAKYQGKSYSLIVVDEAGQYPDPAPIDLLRSCLRAAQPMRPRMVLSANPGGPGHGWLVRRHVFQSAPWVVYSEEKTGRRFINCPSLFTDNPHLDRDEYGRQLDAACATDPELLKAWKAGDWTVARGAFFSAVLDQDRVLVEPWKPGSFPLAEAKREGWSLYLAHDYGASAPSVTYVCAESPGMAGPVDRWYSRGSIVLLDELATNEPGSLERGMGYTVPVLAERIKALAKTWGIRASGVADDAIFSNHGSASGSISDEFRRAGVSFSPAKKADRLTGWEIMRRMLLDAGKPDVPGLYVSRNCEYWWQTVPVLARDPKKSDDVDSRTADHGADACRYALLRRRHTGYSRELLI
jgi:hypothetical protein